MHLLSCPSRIAVSSALPHRNTTWALSRRSRDDRPAWRPEEALTLDQALHATCVAPSWLSHDERSRGTLLPGRLADLVVLDRDPFALPVEELPEVQVVATMVAGRWVHNPPPWD